jgi:hypothetical protein
MHDHVLTFKVSISHGGCDGTLMHPHFQADFDIMGTANTLYALTPNPSCIHADLARDGFV